MLLSSPTNAPCLPLIALLLLVGCAHPTPVDVPRLADPLVLPSIPARGVIVLTLDTLRADHLPMYGYARDTAPFLASLAWFKVSGMRATASWTLPSTASLFTSLEPARHGLLWSVDHVSNDRLHDPTWAWRFHENGVETALFSGNPFVARTNGLSNGFSTAELAIKSLTGQDNLAALNAKALSWLDDLDPEARFLVHMQPMDLHEPYLPSDKDLAFFRQEPLPFGPSLETGAYTADALTELWRAAASSRERVAIEEATIDIYDAQLRGLDRGVQSLFQALDSRKLLDETLVVLTSDHGETLGDPGDGSFGHPFGWREELVILPLLLRGPGIEPGEATCLSQNTDLWPTLAPLLGLPSLQDIDGIDLGLGCREVARGNHWDSNWGLAWLGVAGDESALQRRCSTGAEGGTAFGEAADPSEQTPPLELPDGQTLSVALDQNLTNIQAYQGDAECAREEPSGAR